MTPKKKESNANILATDILQQGEEDNKAANDGSIPVWRRVFSHIWSTC